VRCLEAAIAVLLSPEPALLYCCVAVARAGAAVLLLLLLRHGAVMLG